MSQTQARYVVTSDMVTAPISTSIKAVNPYTKDGVEKVRLQLANGKVAHIGLDQLFGQGFAVPSAAIGMACTVQYYKKGATLVNGSVCTDDETLVQSFSITGQEEAMAEINTALYTDIRRQQVADSMAASAKKRAAYARVGNVPATSTPLQPQPAVSDLAPPVGANASQGEE